MELRTERYFEYDDHGKKTKEIEVEILPEIDYSECDAPCDCCEDCEDSSVFDEELECGFEAEVDITKLAVATLVSSFIGGVVGSFVAKKVLE